MYSSDTMSLDSSVQSGLFSTTKSQFSDADSDRVPPSKLCLVSANPNDTAILAVNSFNLEVVFSKTGEEFLEDPSVIFVLEDFQGETFEKISDLRWRVLGLPALIDRADQMMSLPVVKRPLLSYTMKGVVTCFAGLDREMTKDLMFHIRSMGGSVRREPNRETTHLIACRTTGSKYRYAVTFMVPIMSPEWVRACWEHRLAHGTHATDRALMVHRQKPFLDVYACFLGFPQQELDEAADLLHKNGGTSVDSSDSRCTHIVADDLSPVRIPSRTPSTVMVVTAEWFWTCIQHVVRELESDYKVPLERFRCQLERTSLKRRIRPWSDLGLALKLGKEDTAPIEEGMDVDRETDEEDELHLSRVVATPTGRFRRPSALSLDEADILVQTPERRGSLTSPSRTLTPGTPELFNHGARQSPSSQHPLVGVVAARRGSERSNGSSGASHTQVFPVSSRYTAFVELFHTEENYVSILDTILQMRSEALNPGQAGGVLLSSTEAKIIFSALMPIARTHRAILKDLRSIFNNWTEDANIGEVYKKYSPALLRDYTPFVSSFEEARAMIGQAAERSPRFHAFLKLCRGRPECGRQELHELMIRPVQRLGSCKLLLREILKHTPENSPDRKQLESALESLSEVLVLINEDKRRMELLCQVFDVFNVVDKCPANLIASYRSLILHFEAVELTPHGFSKPGHQISFFVFTDVVMVSKKKSKVVDFMKEQSGFTNIPRRILKLVDGKPYKFLQVLPLSSIRKIVEVVKEDEGAPPVVGLIFRLNADLRESCSYLRLVPGGVERAQVLERWSCALATHCCVADPENFIVRLSAEEAGISQSEYLHKQKRKKALMVATHAFVSNALSLGRSASYNNGLHSPAPCAMSSFNSTSKLDTLKSPCDDNLCDDVFQRPHASSLTANILKRL